MQQLLPFDYGQAILETVRLVVEVIIVKKMLAAHLNKTLFLIF